MPNYQDLRHQAIRITTRILQHQGDKPLNVKVDRSIIQLTDLDLPLWPHITKRQVLAYYASLSPMIVPHLIDRPLSWRTFNQGISSQPQIERYAQSPLPDYVDTVTMYSDLASQNMDFLLCQNTATLLWLVNQCALEFYPWYSRINPDTTKLPTIFINSAGTLEMSAVNYPDYLVFDIDTVNPLSGHSISQTERFKRNQEAALFVNQFLAKHGLTSLVKTSGKNGLHIQVPLSRQYSFEQTRQAAHRIGQQLTDNYPQLFSMGWQLDQQPRVSIDFHQNARQKAFVAPYSLRPTNQATISLPLTWKELEGLADPQQLNLARYFSNELQADFSAFGDIAHQPWSSPNFDQTIPEEWAK